MSKIPIVVHPAYTELRIAYDKAKLSVGADYARQSMDVFMFEHEMQKLGKRPTMNNYKKYIQEKLADVYKSTFEDEVKEMVELYQKEYVDTGKYLKEAK